MVVLTLAVFFKGYLLLVGDSKGPGYKGFLETLWLQRTISSFIITGWICFLRQGLLA